MDAIITLAVLSTGLALIYVGVKTGEKQIREAEKANERAQREKANKKLERWFNTQRRNESVKPSPPANYSEQTTVSDDQ
jgi:hypothetical protein